MSGPKLAAEQAKKANIEAVQQGQKTIIENLTSAPDVLVTAADVKRARIEYERKIQAMSSVMAASGVVMQPFDAAAIDAERHQLELVRLAYENVRDRLLKQEQDEASSATNKLAAVNTTIAHWNKWIAIVVGAAVIVQTIAMVGQWHPWRADPDPVTSVTEMSNKAIDVIVKRRKELGLPPPRE